MKNYFLLVAAACVAVSASAAEREHAAPQRQAIDAVKVSKSVSPKHAKSDLALKKSPVAFKAAKSTRADVEEGDFPALYFRAADDVMSISMAPDGHGYKGLGFASPYGSVDFWNFSMAVKDMQWSYSELNDYEYANNKINWNTATSDDLDLSVKSGVGLFMGPKLTAKSGSETLQADGYFNAVYCGAAPWYFLGEDGEDLGVSYYQNMYGEVKGGFTGTPLEEYGYFPGGDGYEANGVSSAWADDIASMSMYEGKTISDVEIQNISVFLPVPQSGYIMSQSWLWMAIEANAATQLISYIYPINEDGKREENPIAIGYAAIPKGSTDTPVFYYNPLNEDGDELEGDIIIDSAAVVTIEGFNGNDAITSLNTISGFYPIDVNLFLETPYNDIFRNPDLYAGLTYKVDGEPTSSLIAHTGVYYTDDTRTNVSCFCYSQFCMDAVFPWINCDEESVTIPLTGGSADVEINALYYNINAMIEDEGYFVDAPDWINVSFGDSDQQTGNTTMTVTVAANDTDRTGLVELSGLGVKCTLKVIQGVDTGVEVVAVDKNAEYFDLAGRRVANPEKGIYIKKSGNKAEKVLF